MPRIRATSIAAHKAAVRDALFAATSELLLARGYDRTTLSDITSLAGIARTTFYEYFASKEDLLAAYVEESLPALLDDLFGSIDRDAPPEEQLGALASATLSWVATHDTLGPILHREVPKLPPNLQDRIAVAHASLGREFVVAYRRGVEVGALRRLPTDLAGAFIEDLIMSAARVIIRDPSRDFDEVREAMLTMLFSGLQR